MTSALELRDVRALSGLFADDYVFTSAQGETWGRDRAIVDVTDPRLDIRHLRVDLERIVPLGDAAFVTSRSEVDGRVGEEVVSGIFRFTHAWRWRGCRWQLVAGHTSRVESAGR